ncbi:MAG: hypothetical protein KAR45_04735, partial [Desulfobacteraceae bacterium]|nr:hypothetical protein [Desulfobacteraceae bacterium]
MKSLSLGIKIISIFIITMLSIFIATVFFYSRNTAYYKTQIDRVSHDGYIRVFDGVIDHQNRILDKTLTSLFNVDELAQFFENQNDPSSKMVLEGLFLSLKEKKFIRFNIYDKNLKIILQNKEENLPPRPEQLSTNLHSGFKKSAEDFTYYFYFKGSENTNASSTVEYCGVTSVTDEDDNLLGFAEIALQPGAWINELGDVTKCSVAAFNTTIQKFSFSTDKDLYEKISLNLPKTFTVGTSLISKVEEKYFQSDFLPIKEPGGNQISLLWITSDYTEQKKAQLKNQIFILIFFILFMGITVTGVYIFVRRSITKPVNLAIEGLTQSTDQVRDYTATMSASSQSLADKASSQAASTEEISASLEETTSMTARNTENADKTNKLMKETNEIAEKADKFMSDLIISIAKVSDVSNETGNIIKKIEDIAFQTNLLALNAAVEAARAGEAGAGFAVVADEVRNLSIRAAKAASETAELLERSAIEVENSKKNADNTSTVLKEVVNVTDKSGALVSEIAIASKEQKTG